MRNNQYTLKDILTFGKYRGKSIEQILTLDVDYINWCKTNIKGFVIVDSDMNKHNYGDYYSDGLEILKTNPWSSRFFSAAKKLAEEATIVIEQPIKHLESNHQLELQFT